MYMWSMKYLVFMCIYLGGFLYNFCVNWVKNITTRNLLKYKLHTELSDVLHSHGQSKWLRRSGFGLSTFSETNLHMRILKYTASPT